MPRCAATKANGERCQRIVGESQTLCYSHDETRKGERSAAASKAARSKHTNETTEIKRDLRELMDGVLDGTYERGRASVAATVAGVLCRYLELERKIREQDELERRIAELEEAAAHHSSYGGYSRWHR